MLDCPDTPSRHANHDHRAPKFNDKNAEESSIGMSSVIDTSSSDCEVPLTTGDNLL